METHQRAANEKGLAGDAGELLVLHEGRVRVEVQELHQKRFFISKQSLKDHRWREGVNQRDRPSASTAPRQTHLCQSPGLFLDTNLSQCFNLIISMIL